MREGNRDPFATVRVDRNALLRLKRVLRDDPEFTGPPRWTLTELMGRVVQEWCDTRGKRGKGKAA
jgi:hypothetical protein